MFLEPLVNEQEKKLSRLLPNQRMQSQSINENTHLNQKAKAHF
jgi:hypothetical protein